MYGFSKEIWLKLEIYQILANRQSYITSNDILDLLGYSNVETIKKHCHTINNELTVLLDMKEAAIEVNQRYGYKLKEDLVYSNAYAESLFVNDLAYKIYIAAYFNNKTVNSLADVNANIRMYRSDHIRMYNQL